MSVLMKGEVMMHATWRCVVHILEQCRGQFTKFQDPAAECSVVRGGWHQGHPWPVSAPPLRLPPLQVREGTAQCTVHSSIGLHVHNMLQHIRALVLDIAYMYIMTNKVGRAWMVP